MLAPLLVIIIVVIIAVLVKIINYFATITLRIKLKEFKEYNTIRHKGNVSKIKTVEELKDYKEKINQKLKEFPSDVLTNKDKEDIESRIGISKRIKELEDLEHAKEEEIEKEAKSLVIVRIGSLKKYETLNSFISELTENQKNIPDNIIYNLMKLNSFMEKKIILYNKMVDEVNTYALLKQEVDSKKRTEMVLEDYDATMSEVEELAKDEGISVNEWIDEQYVFLAKPKVDSSMLNEMVLKIEKNEESIVSLNRFSEKMISSYLDSDKVTFYTIYNVFEEMGIFTQEWERKLIESINQVNKNLNTAISEIQGMEYSISSSLDDIQWTIERK